MSMEPCLFYFFNHKDFFRPIGSVSFTKNTFVFWHFYMIANFKFRIFTINFFTRVNKGITFNINGFHINCSMICAVVLIYYIIKFINIHIFWYSCHMLINFVLLSSNKSSSNNRFSFIMYWIHFYVIIISAFLKRTVIKLASFV